MRLPGLAAHARGPRSGRSLEWVGQPSVNEAREHVTTPADLFTGRRASAVKGYDSGRDGKVNHEHDAKGSCVRDVRRRQPVGARAELYQARRPRDTVSN